MRILIISHHTCIRALKQATALVGAGHQVHFLLHDIAPAGMWEKIPSMTAFNGTPEGLRDRLKALNDTTFDLIHVHTEPDWMVTVAKQEKPDMPVVYDCHDLDSVRYGEKTEAEKQAFQHADAFIFPSRSYRDYATSLYSLAGAPSAVIYSYVSTGLTSFPQQPAPLRIPGLVYEGAAVAALGGQSEETAKQIKAREYRDYTALAFALHRAGIPFWMMGLTSAFMAEYTKLNALVFPTLPYQWMMRRLSYFEAGYIGCPNSHKQWQMAMPNKLFECLAAGIPVLVHNAAECAEFVRKHKVGIVSDTLGDVIKVYPGIGKFRKNVRKKREQFTMESQVPEIESLYTEAIRHAADRRREEEKA